MHKKSPF